jgi:DNA-binding transcriptional ArsR family regulator
VIVQTTPALHPTLWRTCRVLANRSRLALFGLLVQQPDQTVSVLSKQLGLPMSLTSENLRSLEARGLLTVRRSGRWVKYRLASVERGSPGSTLVPALRAVFRQESTPVEIAFKLTTAFTHPRRVEIFRILHAGACTLEQLNATTFIPVVALRRHLKKLKSRGFIVRRSHLFVGTRHPVGFGRELIRLATREREES